MAVSSFKPVSSRSAADRVSGWPGTGDQDHDAPMMTVDRSRTPARIDVRPASVAHLPDLVGLLDVGELPTVELGRTVFWVGEQGSVVHAVAGLQPLGHLGLVRSVFVSPASRRQGVARRLLEAIVAEARRRGVTELYALALHPSWLEALGFVPVDRALAPEAVRESEEFRSACPASAVLLRRVVVR
jgi:N-acetylglutamate synthase-like GNAT family acetyltransferase